MRKRIALVTVLIGVGTVLGLVLLSVAEEEEPMRLVAVCEGEGTDTVKCTWVPMGQDFKRTVFDHWTIRWGACTPTRSLWEPGWLGGSTDERPVH